MKTVTAGLLLAASAAGQIHFDTDSGYFHDDGVALTILLRSNRAKDVAGISVVTGNVWSREGVEFMQRNANVLGYPKLPVLVGAEAPLVHTREMSKRQGPIQFSGAFAVPVPTTEPPRGGIDLLIKNIEANPGKLTILAIGPLTNLAIALRLRPDLETKIGSLVMMGGAVKVPGNATPAAEFNFWFDPEAAQIVLRSAIPKKVLFALDVCNKSTVTKKMFDEVVAVKTPITALYKESFGNLFPGFLKQPGITTYLWDELAAAYVVNSSLVTRRESMYLDVETTFGKSYGAVKTLNRSIAPNATPVDVALDMDFPKVYDIYRRVLTAK